MCHFFKVNESKAFECPENLNNLELLSFESVKTLTNLPNYFLLAIKLNGNNNSQETFRFLNLYKGNSTDAKDQFFYFSSTQPPANLFKTCPENKKN